MILFQPLLVIRYDQLQMGCTKSTARKICGCKSCAEGRRTNRNVDYLKKEAKLEHVIGLKGEFKLQVDQADDFLTHHLINEASLSKYASSHKIRARQIIQHYMFSQINRNKDSGLVSTSKLTEFALKSWFQRTFYQALEAAERNYFVYKKQYKQIRAQLCEEYIFEIYQMGEFINAGFSRFSTAKTHIEVPLSLVLLNSDSALFPLFQDLQKKYPLVQMKQMKFPDVPKIDQRPNILQYIDSKCYSDLQNLNAQTLMDDLKTIIDEANDLKDDFKEDMKDLLKKENIEVLADCKVKRKQGPQKTYSAEAVRRVFIKWSETLIQKIPEVYSLNEFVEFIRSKKKMAQQFIFKGVVSPTTHQQVIQCLSELLQSLKCKNGTKQLRKQFGLFIYDFLRCKTTRNTPQQVVELLNKLIATRKTKSGKKFQVIRVKNRFQKENRDLLVNFRYGQHLVAQVQLCVDTAHQSDEIERKINFRHLLYELQRGLFGPTFQMIMLYEDESRKDIQVNLQTQGPIKKRNFSSIPNKIALANRKCPQMHQMIKLTSNLFAQDKIVGLMQSILEFNFCDFCFNKFYYNETYHYCYYCSIFYCQLCSKTYEKVDKKNIQLLGINHSFLQPIQTPQRLKQICEERKSALVVFHRPGTSASRVFLDQLAYFITAFRALSKPLPEIFTISVGKKDFRQLMKNDWRIDRAPTTVIFNSKMKPQVTIVGATFHDIQSLLKVKNRIAKNQPKGLSLKCTQCHKIMVAKDKKGQAQSVKCQICMDTSKIEDLQDIVRLFLNQTHDYVCPSGHVRCSYCSYLSSDRHSYYRDYTGRTYLSNKFATQDSVCPNDHDMEAVTQPDDYKCFNCKRELKGNPGESISYCKECNVYICIQCQQTDTENYRQQQYKAILLKQIETVNHFVENRLENSYPCGCGKYFLKVYQTRRLDQNLKIQTILKEVMNGGALTWTCRICNQRQEKLKLHLACFYCSYASKKAGKPAHTEICLRCAQISCLIPRTSRQRVIQQKCQLKCDKGHQTVLTSKRYGDRLYFTCNYCQNQFYPFTQRVQCRLCKLKICKDCSQKKLGMKAAQTKKKCTKSHDLAFQKTAPRLQFCKLCCTYLQGPHFKCPGRICDYYLCLTCSQK